MFEIEHFGSEVLVEFIIVGLDLITEGFDPVALA